MRKYITTFSMIYDEKIREDDEYIDASEYEEGKQPDYYECPRCNDRGCNYCLCVGY